VVEDEVKRPAGVHVRVAEARQDGRRAQVDHPGPGRVDAQPPVTDPGDAAALDEDVAVERPLVAVAVAREDAGVGEERPACR
jgi:hypothetical protein